MINSIEFLKPMMEMFKDKEAKETKKSNESPILSLLRKNPETKEACEKIEEEAKKERSSIFSEMTESFLNRYFPNISKVLDLISNATGTADPEAYALQNEFETFTAFSMFVPDFLARHLYQTDFFAKNENFLLAVEKWPIPFDGDVFGPEAAQRIRDEKNPDDVINTLRAMHQDIILGKITIDNVRDLF